MEKQVKAIIEINKYSGEKGEKGVFFRVTILKPNEDFNTSNPQNPAMLFSTFSSKDSGPLVKFYSPELPKAVSIQCEKIEKAIQEWMATNNKSNAKKEYVSQFKEF